MTLRIEVDVDERLQGGKDLPCCPGSEGVTGELSPAAVSPYVLAGDGSRVTDCLTSEVEVRFSTDEADGRATPLEPLTGEALADLLGVAGE